ncbi:MAG: hypothetical protein ACR2PY_05095 [Salinispira sp.]
MSQSFKLCALIISLFIVITSCDIPSLSDGPGGDLLNFVEAADQTENVDIPESDNAGETEAEDAGDVDSGETEAEDAGDVDSGETEAEDAGNNVDSGNNGDSGNNVDSGNNGDSGDDEADPERVNGVLAEDTEFDGIVYASHSSLTFYSNGQVSLGTLAEDTEIDGILYAANTEVIFYGDGQLHSATLVEDTEINGIFYAGGSMIFYDTNGNVTHGDVI